MMAAALTTAPIPPSMRPPPDPEAARAAKRRPQPRLRAVDDGAAPVADWASLFGDLARPASTTPDDPVEWRLHDKTHLEFAIDYRVRQKPVSYTWEAYFFVPESFRLDAQTYDKKDIYDDLWSYVRYAVPDVPFHDFAGGDERSPLSGVDRAIRAADGAAEGSDASVAAMRQLRLFACLVRGSGVAAMRELERQIAARDEMLPAHAARFIATCDAVARAFRKLLAEWPSLRLADEVRIAAAWTDEDLSLVLETLAASLGVSIETVAEGRPQLHDVGEKLAAYAVAEARHRAAAGYDSVGHADATERDVEHLEFRRHVLKRFTASVLWLHLEVRSAATWVIHTFYAFAAAVAMAFAFIASVRATPTIENLYRYGLLIVIAYAVKDRMKAFLQQAFAGFIARRFPDRRWRIKDEHRREVGQVHERAAFLPFRSLPDEVLAKRRLTREHAVEEHARPERVLWHTKTIEVSGSNAKDGAEFPMLTDIFRLNLRRWLYNTDDPNRKIVFADPKDARVYTATARRVYNINVVYRLREGEGATDWKRLRVVVSRKGIERIEPIC